MNIYSRGDSKNPVHLYTRKLKEKTGIYMLAICAGARKLLSMIWIMLTYQKDWKPKTLTDSEFIHLFKEKIEIKINIYNSKVKNYQKIQSKLSELLVEDISELDLATKYLKEFKNIFELVV